jgi:hypothetical protein
MKFGFPFNKPYKPQDISSTKMKVSIIIGVIIVLCAIGLAIFGKK